MSSIYGKDSKDLASMFRNTFDASFLINTILCGPVVKQRVPVNTPVFSYQAASQVRFINI